MWLLDEINAVAPGGARTLLPDYAADLLAAAQQLVPAAPLLTLPPQVDAAKKTLVKSPEACH